MTVAIRPVLPGDRQELLDLLERNLGASQQARFDWRHEQNPAGQAWSWFVYDCRSKATVGMASVFPRHMRLHGKPVRGGQVGDFVIDQSHRSLGPAVMLQRSTFQPVDSGALSFCYDCPPHDRGMSTFVRLKMQANCNVIRYVFLLRSDEYLGKKLGNSIWSKPLISATNLVLSSTRPKYRQNSVEISAFDERFGDEFSALDKQVPSSDSIRTSRSAADLNWRYRDDPVMAGANDNTQYRVLVARRAGELFAFLVFFKQSDGIVSMVDVFGHDLADIGRLLLSAAIEISRNEKMQAIHAYCSQEPALTMLFRNAGFRPRERAMRIVAYTKSGNEMERSLQDSGLRWPFTQVETLV